MLIKHSSSKAWDGSAQGLKTATIHAFKSNKPLMNSTASDTQSSLTHCSVCTQPYTRPVTLSCGYTACQACISCNDHQCLSFTCIRNHQNEQNQPNILLTTLLQQHSQQQQIEPSLFDCAVCCSPLVEPVTTECGHTFCKLCLNHVMGQWHCCPICRHALNRIGTVDRLLQRWHASLSDSPEPDPPSTHLPLIQLSSQCLIFPSQPCVLHIPYNRSFQSLLTPSGPHYAICLFSRDPSTVFYEYGTMVQLNHVDTSPDQSHTVIQAVGLFRVKVNQLALDPTDQCYYGEIIRLDDDREIPHSEENRRLPPITQSPPLSPIHRPRPFSMRQSPSSPTFRPAEAYLPFTRPSWNHLTLPRSFQPQLSPLLNTFLAPSLSPIDPYTLNLVDELLLKLHPLITKHLSLKAHLTQYQWYLDHKPQSTEALIWWLALTLPLSTHQKLEFYGKNTLYERTHTLCLLCQSL